LVSSKSIPRKRTICVKSSMNIKTSPKKATL
jgi:hypothetical protein